MPFEGQPLIEGNLLSILSFDKSVGGAPANVTIDLSKIDSSISLQVIGVTGNDEDDQYLVNLLKQNGIDTSQIEKDSTIRISFTDVMIVESTGNRSFFITGEQIRF